MDRTSSYPAMPQSPHGGPQTPAQGWESTRVQTRVSPHGGEEEGESADAHADIGRAVGNDTRELFVSCEPAEALSQQFDHLQPEYVAVHDIGTNASLKLLAGIAAAGRRPVQKLVIRRPGGGITLATLQYVECAAEDGRQVRLYSTEVDGDTATRQSTARVLLARSRLAVMLVGDLPGHALASALEAWRPVVLGGGWGCRNIVFMPLTPSAVVPAQAERFRTATGLDVQATLQVTRPAEVWAQLCKHWNRAQRLAYPAGAGRAPMLLSEAGEAPLTAAVAARPLTPMPSVGQAAQMARTPLERYVAQLAQVPGVVSCCVIDFASGQPLAHAGARPGPEDLARHGAALTISLMNSSRAMGLGASVPEAVVTLGQHHLMLRPVPGHAGLVLHAVLDKPQVNLGVVQLQVRKLDDTLVK